MYAGDSSVDGVFTLNQYRGAGGAGVTGANHYNVKFSAFDSDSVYTSNGNISPLTFSSNWIIKI